MKTDEELALEEKGRLEKLEVSKLKMLDNNGGYLLFRLTGFVG